MNGQRPARSRYAHPEREQRWLVDGVPEGAVRAGDIVDRYITGTSLRIRRVEAPDHVIHKLTQKVRPAAHDPMLVLLTTMYLPADEVTALSELPHAEVRKTRWHVAVDGRTVAVDEFHGRLEGLVLAEVELADGEDRLPPPPFARKEVTDDERFRGACLAQADDGTVGEILAMTAAER